MTRKCPQQPGKSSRESIVETRTKEINVGKVAMPEGV